MCSAHVFITCLLFFSFPLVQDLIPNNAHILDPTTGKYLDFVILDIGLVHLQLCAIAYLQHVGLGCLLSGPQRDGTLLHNVLKASTMPGPTGKLVFQEGRNFLEAHIIVYNVVLDESYEEAQGLEAIPVMHKENGILLPLGESFTWANGMQYDLLTNTGFILPDVYPEPDEPFSREAIVLIVILCAFGLSLLLGLVYASVHRNKALLLARDGIQIVSAKPILTSRNGRTYLLRGTYKHMRVTYELIDSTSRTRQSSGDTEV